MTKQEMTLHNETLALCNIRDEYAIHGLIGAMRLCQTYMGMDTQGAYAEVKRLCKDLDEEDEL